MKSSFNTARLNLLIAAAILIPINPSLADPPVEIEAAAIAPDETIDQSPLPKAAPRVETLQTIITRANGTIRRAGDAPIHESDVLAAMQSPIRLKLSGVTFAENPDGSLNALSATFVNRNVSFNNSASEREIREKSRQLGSTEAAANKRVRDFKSKWTRTIKSNKSGEPTVMWVHPGCQKRFKPKTDANYQQTLGNIIAEGQRSIDSARASLASARERSATLRESTLKKARTVDTSIRLPADSQAVADLRLGRAVTLELEVTGITIGRDHENVIGGGRYVSAIHLAPTTSLTAK
ncbi:MAG: hypothetical protein KF912_03725 [Phycisphaeraceae bacterium]|nr:hypothetical protein [Phycisphaeraceae bacterium]MBX3366406.1 hypothetical protein [Phycisphaeraceae bacterium]QYK47099.1 MAG: hypothetical protein KF838_09925 [Phycisphaeraceae bacterium]